MSRPIRIANVIVLATVFTVGALAGYVFGVRGVPFVGRYTEWSIGLYVGNSPLEISPDPTVTNPILTGGDVTDCDADYVADPFLMRKKATWHLFLEVVCRESEQGEIAVATSSDLKNWKYEGIVLDEPFHLSYPQIFSWQGQTYMIPETHEANGVRLYKATSFPKKWRYVKTLLSGVHADPSIFRYDDRWWMYTSASTGNDVLRLYSSLQLEGPWLEHPKSPIVYLDASKSRPAGRVLVTQNRIIRFGQDSLGAYGRRVRAFEVTELTPDTYAEKELAWDKLSPSGTGWNAGGMHHVDLQRLSDGRWIASVDGWRRSFRYGWTE